MSLSPALQSSRYELKYLVSEATARAVRDFCLSYLEPDEHDDPAEGFEYSVHSLYLDSPNLSLCRQTLQGHKNRFKLRIRFYDESPDSPAFLEIKRRQNDVILKQRCAVRRVAVQRILAGHWPTSEDVLDKGPRGLSALTEFCHLTKCIQADGKVFVSYKREAYVTTQNNSVRLTFDRRLFGTRYEGLGELRVNGCRVYPEMQGVILELKFTDRFPVWMRHLCRVFSLERRSVAKYCYCAHSLNIPQLQLVV
ncbi:MAG: polyphosphate polymerase domain-containing protein [Planctomycetota bacterium]|nr:polyphosphate polymerase domain-containing protein [Planctomycetota bacterium]